MYTTIVGTIFGRHIAKYVKTKNKQANKNGPAVSTLGIYLVYVLAKRCLDVYKDVH